MGSFQVVYNAGGTLDEVKKLKQADNLTNVEVVEEINNLKNVEVVEEVRNVSNVVNVTNVDEVANVSTVGEVSKVKGFATLTQPYNMMKMFEIPANEKDPITGGDFEFELDLPLEPIEVLAITLTCSGYGEEDHYDLFFNGIQWFEDWYCSEVKEGLFLGTSTYVYEAVPGSKIKLIFKNDSGTQKKLWLGVRMLRN